MKSLSVILLLGAMLASCSKPAGNPAVTVSDAWCRQPPPGAPAQACYAVITASQDDRLTAVETPAAARVEIHEMSMEGDIMRMRELKEGLALLAGKPITLGPGGLHLMVIAPTSPNGPLPLTLRFEHAPPVSVEAPVRAGAPAAAHH